MPRKYEDHNFKDLVTIKSSDGTIKHVMYNDAGVYLLRTLTNDRPVVKEITPEHAQRYCVRYQTSKQWDLKENENLDGIVFVPQSIRLLTGPVTLRFEASIDNWLMLSADVVIWKPTKVEADMLLASQRFYGVQRVKNNVQ